MAKNNLPRDFGFGSEEEMLRDLARKFLDEKLPEDRLRDLTAADHLAVYEQGERAAWDESLWADIVEMGWTGLAVPEDCDGINFRLVGIASLVEEAGRHALPAPLLSTLAASFVLRSAKTDASRTALHAIAEGKAASLAITDARGSWEPEACDIKARTESKTLVLSGTASFVQDAFKAESFIVSARHEDGLVLCLIPKQTEGAQLLQDHIHDLTRDQARLRLDNVSVPTEDVLSWDGERVLGEAWPALLILLAADLCGTSEWQLQTTVEYARQRKQFERPLGFFQAVKHPLVEAMVAIDRARSLLYHAACCWDEKSDDAEQAARMAKSAASDAGAYISDRSVQLHGGIGFTWESSVHLFFKRSMHSQALFGDAVHQRRKLAAELIGPIES